MQGNICYIGTIFQKISDKMKIEIEVVVEMNELDIKRVLAYDLYTF